MKARDDIDPATTWLISDTHFGHKNIIGYGHRPENFEDILLENLSVVQPGETLLHLGDLCYRGNAWFKNVIAPKIAPGARKLLILGNHDRQRMAFYKQTGWHITATFYLPIVQWASMPLMVADADSSFDHIVSFSHYPWSVEDHRGKLPGEFRVMAPSHHRIHGHIHNNGYFDDHDHTSTHWNLIPFLAQHTNLSCEMTKYKPVRLNLLLDAVLYGRLPQPPSLPSDGDSPSRSDLGGENPHA